MKEEKEEESSSLLPSPIAEDGKSEGKGTEGSSEKGKASESDEKEKGYDNVLPFSVLCGFYERCSETSKTTAKKMLLKKLLRVYPDPNIYPLVRLVSPQLDRERGAYGLKESTLAKAYIQIHALHINSPAAQRLLNYRTPTHGNTEVVGDFGASVYSFLQKRTEKEGKCSIAKINRYLDMLQREFDRKKKLEVLKKLIRSTSALEQKWLVRLILKNLNIGMSLNGVLDCLHPKAAEAYALSSNLAEVCRDVRNPQSSLQSSVKLMWPIKPMLAARRSPQELTRLVNRNQHILEPKFDGERLQLHKDGQEYKLFSRNCNDVTTLYLPKLKSVFDELIKAQSCILDGEVLVWDPATSSFEPFGGLKTVAKAKDGNRNAIASTLNDCGAGDGGKRLCYMVFDCLYVNGREILSLDLQKRKQILEKLIPQQKTKSLELVKSKTIHSKDDVLSALDEAIVNGDEGVMLKGIGTEYVPDERKEKWIKLKPEYIEGLVDTLDLLVLGGYYGRGSQGDGRGYRAGIVSHFLLGVKAPPGSSPHPDAIGPFFWSICKVASGATRSELQQLQSFLASAWRPYSINRPPPHFELANRTFEKPDVWLAPQRSVVIQVKCAQINPSARYRTGYTTRFPRLERVRVYKSPEDVLDYTGLMEMIQRPKAITTVTEGKNTLGFDEEGGELPSTAQTKKRKRGKGGDGGSRGGGVVMLPHFKSADVTAIEVKERLFDGVELFVLNGDTTYSKQNLEVMLHEYGAKCRQSAAPTTRAVIVGNGTVRMRNIISQGTHDVLHYQWIIDSIERSHLLELCPKYVVFLTAVSKQKMQASMDEWGDSYVVDSDLPQLKRTIEFISSMATPTSRLKSERKSEGKQVLCRSTSLLTETFQHQSSNEASTKKLKDEDRERLEQQLFVEVKPLWILFRSYVVYLDHFAIVGEEKTLFALSPLRLIEKEIQFYGGKTTSVLDKTVTHIILHESDISRLSALRKRARELYKKPPHMAIHICMSKWVTDSLIKKTQLEEKDYFPPGVGRFQTVNWTQS